MNPLTRENKLKCIIRNKWNFQLMARFKNNTNRSILCQMFPNCVSGFPTDGDSQHNCVPITALCWHNLKTVLL